MVSNNLGHLDFGGNGFIRLAEMLLNRGHDTYWIAHDKTAERLKIKGHNVCSVKSISPVPDPEKVTQDQIRIKTLLTELDQLRFVLFKYKPDLCLVDRNLGLSTMVLSSLDIPYVCIGTPGGYWGRDSQGVAALSEPCSDYQKLGELVCQKSGWLSAELNSWWQPSPYLNVVFMGRSFYPSHADEMTSAFVNVFDSPPENVNNSGKSNRLGIALGHTGDVNLPLMILDTLNDKIHQTFSGVDIFAGGRPDILNKLKKTHPNCCVHDWTPYSEIFPNLKKLICFGGVGTLWHSIQYKIPSIVIAGGAGDQKINAEQIQRLGMGFFWDASAQKLPDLFESNNVSSQQKAFKVFHCGDNYTDNLKTLIVKIENIAKMH